MGASRGLKQNLHFTPFLLAGSALPARRQTAEDGVEHAVQRLSLSRIDERLRAPVLEEGERGARGDGLAPALGDEARTVVLELHLLEVGVGRRRHHVRVDRDHGPGATEHLRANVRAEDHHLRPTQLRVEGHRLVADGHRTRLETLAVGGAGVELNPNENQVLVNRGLLGVLALEPDQPRKGGAGAVVGGDENLGIQRLFVHGNSLLVQRLMQVAKSRASPWSFTVRQKSGGK